MKLNFDAGSGQLQNWLVAETQFDVGHLPKVESIFAQGNGRFGLRAATEEAYPEECRNLFVAGTFNCPQGEHEVPELPNVADIIDLPLLINGVRFSLDKGEIVEYERVLNLQNGELRRTVVWKSPAGDVVRLLFGRFISLDDLQLYAAQVQIEPISGDVAVTIQGGINGRITNSGVQHFVAGEMRFFDKRIGLLHQTTSQSNVAFVQSFVINHFVNGERVQPASEMKIGRRDMQLTSRIQLPQNSTLTIEKFANIFTSRDKGQSEPVDSQALKEQSKEHIAEAAKQRYADLFAKHQVAWADFWQQQDIQIESNDSFDQLAIRFALYHLKIMTPAHDERTGIGAKGYTGEGYKGHSFWDTEIYMLPVWMYTQPDVARSLLTYRFGLLPAARKKARDSGYIGAMYPWETAWMTDGEATPEWGNVDHLTGEREKIWTGFIQQHISADIAYAVWQYFEISNDHDFMERCGYQIIFETADFWQSRLEWDEAHQRYGINNVIGPDEYKEHVNNNAFTNQMAYWNMAQALTLYDKLTQEQPELLEKLRQSIELERIYQNVSDKLPRLYCPQPNAQNLIPQDDTYLTLPNLPELERFKQADSVLTIFKEYSMPQISQYQVSKQADLIVLFLLLPKLFPESIQKINFDYYESKTLHDSSLSYAMHTLLAAKLGRPKLAFTLWQKAARVDLNQNSKASQGGIHAAAMGGIWQDVVLGFGGLHIQHDKIMIKPALPSAWESLAFPFVYRGNRFRCEIRQDELCVSCIERVGALSQVCINDEWVDVHAGQAVFREKRPFSATIQTKNER